MQPPIDLALAICETPSDRIAPGRLAEAARLLGELAAWWLRPELLRRIEQTLCCQFAVPQVPSTCGAGLALFAQQPAGRWPLLRDALPLPLAWRKDTGRPLRLPYKLVDLARQIAEQLELLDWRLEVHPNLVPNVPDLRPMDELVEVASAWAPLAAGLVVASQAGRPDPAVWATGAWSETEGIKPVQLDAKLELAGKLDARIFFVPASQKEQAERLAPGNLAVGTLVEGTTDPRQALRDLLAELDVPPGRHESPENRVAWFLRCPDDDRARDYYRTNLLPDIADRLRSQWQQAVAAAGSRLVTIASDNPELAFLALTMTQAERCLVLYTEDKRKQFEQLQELATGGRVECQISPGFFASADALVKDCPAAVAEFAAGLPPAQLVLDLTPGTKDMTIALLTAAAQRGNRLIYLRHRRQGPKVVPFTERVLTWTAGDAQMTKRELKSSGQSTVEQLS